MKLIDPTPGLEYLRSYLTVRSQIRILYSQSVITFLFPILAAIYLIIIIWDVANKKVLYVWFSLVIIHAIFRYLILWRYFKDKSHQQNADKWLLKFITCVIISGFLWGLSGISLIPYDGNNSIEFALYNGLVLITICGLVAGALISYSINLWVLACYSFPALVPPAFYLISLGDQYNTALGGLVLLYYFFITVAALRMNSQFKYYMEMEYQQEKLQHKYENLRNRFSEFRKHVGR